MKNFIRSTFLLLLSMFFISCSQIEKLPLPVSTIEQAKSFIVVKDFKVIDVATISESQESFFDKDKLEKHNSLAPTTESLNWLSNKKAGKNYSEFANSFYN